MCSDCQSTAPPLDAETQWKAALFASRGVVRSDLQSTAPPLDAETQWKEELPASRGVVWSDLNLQSTAPLWGEKQELVVAVLRPNLAMAPKAGREVLK